MTTRFLRVATWAILATVLAPRTSAEESDPNADLRLARRSTAPVPERLAAATRLAAAGLLPDPGAALYAAAALLGEDAAVAGALVRAALDSGEVGEEALAAVHAAASARLAAATASGEAARQRGDLAAILGLLGEREPLGACLDAGPPSAFMTSVLRRDAPTLFHEGAPPVTAEAWAAHVEAATLLDRATADDPAVSGPAMDALRARGATTLPLLLATAARGEVPTPPGLLARRVRALVVLGTMGDARALPVLEAALSDHEPGWVRVAAANALGDLGLPAAVVPLARTLFYLGDVHRPRDSWDYPGVGNTDVAVEEWNDVDYYAIDSALADALLRLGVRDAAEWLLRERLDPRTGRWRIRVLQDAVDAIRRAFPQAPKGFEPDAGFPQRQAAWNALLAWWRTGPLLRRPLDEGDPGFVAAMGELADSIGGKGVGVMNLQIAKRAAGLIGPPATPSLLRTLAASKSRLQRAELVLVLGAVRDRRAIGPLLERTHDEAVAVRANAAEALAAYADPPDAALLSGEAAASEDAIVARWIQLLDDPEAGPRASAMKALTSLPPREDVRRALATHDAATHPENAFGDYELAQAVVTLLQTGEGQDALLGVLAEKDLFRRRFVWELLRPALRLEPRAFDPAVDPGTPRWKPLEPELVRAAVRTRRSGS